MRIGLYNVVNNSRNLMGALERGFPDYFSPKSRWKFTYKQPSMSWRDGVDPQKEGDLVVEKMNENSARVKVSAQDKRGQTTSTIIGTLSK